LVVCRRVGSVGGRSGSVCVAEQRREEDRCRDHAPRSTGVAVESYFFDDHRQKRTFRVWNTFRNNEDSRLGILGVTLLSFYR
jgi:hypothetical protein